MLIRLQCSTILKEKAKPSLFDYKNLPGSSLYTTFRTGRPEFVTAALGAILDEAGPILDEAGPILGPIFRVIAGLVAILAAAAAAAALAAADRAAAD